jgi:hypothetical protein
MCRFFSDPQHLAAAGSIEYLSAAPGNKKPPATMVAGGGI